MRRCIVLGFLMLALAAVASAIHPFGTVKRDRVAPLLAGAHIDAANFARIFGSCANCHSEHVDWPWYSYVAPLSWAVESDVHKARSRLNLSRWAEYSVDERAALLSAIGNVAKLNAMPPLRYRALHPESVLSEAGRNALYDWTKSERRRLRSHSNGRSQSE